MELHFTTEQEAQLARILEQQARFSAAVREGILQADHGEFIEEEEMDSRFERMLAI
jgi:predicted transcriptional regulator